MSKLIREGRFGPPKSFKTGSIVGSYPKPMLVLSLDQGGVDIIPSKGASVGANQFKLDITQEDIVTIKPEGIVNYINKPMSEQPKVLNIDFASSSVAEISLTFEPLRDNQSFPKLIATVNMILKSKCPWKTVLWDNLTRTSEFIHSYMAVENPNMLKDARQWAYGIGQKIGGINSQFVKLPCHYIVLMHETTEKNETTGSVVTEPMIFSQYRNVIGGVMSSFFHQMKSGGKPVLDTSDNGYIKGIGQRWPSNLPNPCGPLFTDIYGDSIKSGEITLL